MAEKLDNIAKNVQYIVHGVSFLHKFNIDTALGAFRHDLGNKTYPLHCKVAVSYGNLTSESLQKMDEQLKVCIQATIRAVDKAEDDSWPTVLASMMNNPVLEYEQGRDIKRHDKYTVEKEHMLRHGFDPVINNEVQFWFKKLINDDDIIADLHIDKDGVAKFVAEYGATIDRIVEAVVKAEYMEQNVLYAGILRYPDLDHPYFKLYKVQLKAWRDNTRLGWKQTDRNGITGDFLCLHFKPRDEVIARMSPTIRKVAAAEADKLLDGII